MDDVRVLAEDKDEVRVAIGVWVNNNKGGLIIEQLEKYSGIFL